MTPELIRWIEFSIEEARTTAASPTIPSPLIDSPKCVRCFPCPGVSPDETRQLIEGPDTTRSGGQLIEAKTIPSGKTKPPRRLIAKKDVKRVVYLTTAGSTGRIWQRRHPAMLEKGKVLEEIPWSMCSISALRQCRNHDSGDSRVDQTRNPSELVFYRRMVL